MGRMQTAFIERVCGEKKEEWAVGLWLSLSLCFFASFHKGIQGKYNQIICQNLDQMSVVLFSIGLEYVKVKN